jgi:hypothetical protein
MQVLSLKWFDFISTPFLKVLPFAKNGVLSTFSPFSSFDKVRDVSYKSVNWF